LLRKWLAILPHPFSAADRAAGYRYDIAVWQAEFSLTQVLRAGAGCRGRCRGRTQHGPRFRDLGRLRELGVSSPRAAQHRYWESLNAFGALQVLGHVTTRPMTEPGLDRRRAPCQRDNPSPNALGNIPGPARAWKVRRSVDPEPLISVHPLVHRRSRRPGHVCHVPNRMPFSPPQHNLSSSGHGSVVAILADQSPEETTAVRPTTPPINDLTYSVVKLLLLHTVTLVLRDPVFFT
jgi:hypothetical protein